MKKIYKIVLTGGGSIFDAKKVFALSFEDACHKAKKWCEQETKNYTGEFYTEISSVSYEETIEE